MFTLIAIAVTVVLVVAGIGTLLLRKKRVSRMSPSEKLACTLSMKLSKLIRSLNKGLMTPELVREQILNQLDKYKEEVLDTYRNNMISIRKALEDIRLLSYENSQAKSEVIVGARESDDKTEYANRLAILNKQAEMLDKSSKSLSDKYDAEVQKVRDFKFAFESKKADILIKITEYSVNSVEISDFNIDDLVLELRDRSIETEQTNLVNSITAPRLTYTTSVSKEDVESAIKELENLK